MSTQVCDQVIRSLLERPPNKRKVNENFSVETTKDVKFWTDHGL